MPRVSVIIPTYNRARYLPETLESVFAQTYRDYEVIVIDDGSTDNTAEVLESYLDRIVYVRKENGGQGSARNAGLKIARGEYIAFLDSDDLWLPDKLELQVRYLDEHPDVGLVFTDYVIFEEKGSKNKTEIGNIILSKKDLTFKRLLYFNFIPNLTVMIRKSCFDNVGLFDESRELIGGEDYDMWLRISMKYKLGHISKILAKYRQHPGNIVGKDLERGYSIYFKVINKILKYYPNILEEFNIDIRKHLHKSYYLWGKNYYEHRQYKVAIEHLKTALLLYPIAPKTLMLYLLSLVHNVGRHKTVY